MKWCYGNDLGVPKDDNYLVVETESPRVVFSYARKGNGMTVHFACERRDLRQLESACEEFIDWIFDAYPWCEMLFAIVGKRSVERLVLRLGFKKVAEDEAKYYMRARSWDL